jgi:hypothetical protein
VHQLAQQRRQLLTVGRAQGAQDPGFLRALLAAGDPPELPALGRQFDDDLAPADAASS